MVEKQRIGATIVIWFLSMLAIVITATSWQASIFNTIVIAAMTVLLTGFMWRWGILPVGGNQQAEESAKSKRRDRVNDILNALSDTELRDLRSRLTDQVRDDEFVAISDDGELVHRYR